MSLILGCADNRPQIDYESPKTAPLVQNVEINKEGEAIVELTLINSETWSNPVLNRLNEAIKKSRAKKVETKLALLKNERITFSNSKVIFKKNGDKEVTIDVHYNDEVHPVFFVSPEKHEDNFLFLQTTRFKEKEIKLQGLCLDAPDGCDELAFQISYYVDKLKITEQFIVQNPNTKQPVKEENEEIPVDLDTTPKDTSPQQELPPQLSQPIHDDDDSTPLAMNDDPTLNSPSDDGSADFVQIPITNIDEDEDEDEEKEHNDFTLQTPSTSKLKSESLEKEIHSPETYIGGGHLIFPNLDDKTPDGTMEFNINTGKTYVIKQKFIETSDKLLSHLLNTKFNQSRKWNNNGYLKNPNQLPDKLVGAKINPRRRVNHYASGLSTSFIEYISLRFHERYSSSPICVHDLSRKKGGSFGHDSHKNGLDIDVAYPSSPNKCSTSYYFKNWNSLKKKDSEFMKKNWEFIQLLFSTKRVQVVFLDKKFMTAMCTYVKKHTSTPKAQRIAIFTKLYHQKRHRNHYHIRLVCNKQNAGCRSMPQPAYKHNMVSCK